MASDRDVSVAGSSYIELALREYLAMRAEMNDLIRLETNLIVSALVIVGSAAAAMATNFAGMDDAGRAFVLQIAATFGLIMFIAAIGVANMFIILEEYVTTAAREIEQLASAGQRRNLGSIQRRIRTWTRSLTAPHVMAWFISYGTTQILAVVALVVIGALAFGGFVGGGGGAPSLGAWRNVVAVADAILAALAVAILIVSLLYLGRWPDVMDSNDITRPTEAAAPQEPLDPPVVDRSPQS